MKEEPISRLATFEWTIRVREASRILESVRDEIECLSRFVGRAGALQSLDASIGQTGKTMELLDSMEARH